MKPPPFDTPENSYSACSRLIEQALANSPETLFLLSSISADQLKIEMAAAGYGVTEQNNEISGELLGVPWTIHVNHIHGESDIIQRFKEFQKMFWTNFFLEFNNPHDK